MQIKPIILLLCLAVTSCAMNPSSDNRDNNHQSNIPHFDYDKTLNAYLSTHKDEINKRDINTTLINAKKSIIKYLNTVGAINECSNYTITSRNIAGAKQLANPVNINDAKNIALSIKDKAKDYAKSNNEHFNWSWNSSNDIKAGRDSRRKYMDNIYLDTELKYISCQRAARELTNPTFDIIKYNYFITFEKNYVKRLMAKASAAIHYECREEIKDFYFLPTGFYRITKNTFNTTNVDKIINKNGRISREDRKRYQKAHNISPFAKLFTPSPCKDFQKEYYEMLKNVQFKIKWN